MSEIAVSEATLKLSDAIRGMGENDLIEVYGELFPEQPTPEGGIESTKEKVFDYLHHGLEIEEVLDLWNVVFPKDREVHYDEEDQMIHFLNRAEIVPSID
jgi:hypothetical protein